jgi:hypothetical protein
MGKKKIDRFEPKDFCEDCIHKGDGTQICKGCRNLGFLTEEGFIYRL